MADTVTPALLTLDIGASKHAFALDYRGHRDAGEIRNDPADIRPSWPPVSRPTAPCECWWRPPASTTSIWP